MSKKIDKSKISEKYNTFLSKYKKLGLNLTQAFELILKENEIPYLSINYRIKNIESFLGKIERKSYENPFEEIEDICGIRIVCYYQSDVERIKEIVKRELIVLENENKEDKLEFDQFGYRSMHFIIQVPKEWLTTPNYRGLEELKSELQVRTVLMHAWAEIEHKLAYKSESQIPKEFRRKLSRISAKLEESDEQFEEIKVQIDKNKMSLINLANETKGFNPNTEFNLDNMQAFLDYGFPNRSKDIKDTSDLFDEMVEYKMNLKELILGFEKYKSVIEKIEGESRMTFEPENENHEIFWTQGGAARTIMELTNEMYFQSRSENPDMDIIKKYRK